MPSIASRASAPRRAPPFGRRSTNRAGGPAPWRWPATADPHVYPRQAPAGHRRDHRDFCHAEESKGYWRCFDPSTLPYGDARGTRPAPPRPRSSISGHRGAEPPAPPRPPPPWGRAHPRRQRHAAAHQPFRRRQAARGEARPITRLPPSSRYPCVPRFPGARAVGAHPAGPESGIAPPEAASPATGHFRSAFFARRPLRPAGVSCAPPVEHRATRRARKKPAPGGLSHAETAAPRRSCRRSAARPPAGRPGQTSI